MEAAKSTKPIAVGYYRVSSVAQVTKGQGIESQAARCAEFARTKGYEVVRIFEDKAVSGSVIDRPGMKDLLAFLRAHRRETVRVIIDDISRLARGLEALRAAISGAGGVLESPSIEFGEDSDSQLIEHLLASVSAHARVKNAEQTRNRMEARIRSGYWPFSAIPGYRMERREGHGKLLVRDEPVASILQEALEGFAAGRFQTQAEMKRFLEAEPRLPKPASGKLGHQYVPKLLDQPLYAGLIGRADWGVSLRKAKHEGLIDIATLERIQERLRGTAYAPTRANLNEDFPLRGAVACAECGHPLTASWSKSKTGARHPYYMCFQKGCGSYRKSIRREAIESEFEALLESLAPTETLFALMRRMFEDAWEQRRTQAMAAAQTIRRRLRDAEAQIQGLLDRVVGASN
ncbi:MAG: recombinase family protein [Pseudomonadota bacterium]